MRTERCTHLHRHVAAGPALLVLPGIGADTRPASAQPTSPDAAFVRLNQVGYILGEPKQAIVLAARGESGAPFSLL